MVSVVMATYNGEKYIIEQMDSIRCQTRMPDEVIFCDDCSSDRTVSIIMNYIEKHELIGWKIERNTENLGYFDNFFKAISMSRGDTVYLSDQDDIWDLRKIERFEKYYKKNSNITMIQSNMRFIDGEGKEVRSDYNYHGKTQKSAFVELTPDDMCKFAGSGYTMSFRRSVIDTIYNYGLQKSKSIFLYHDILLGLSAVALGKCYMCTVISDCHRLHDSNVTQTEKGKYISDRTKIKQLEILSRRVQEFDLIIKIAEMNTTCFEKYKSFAQERKDLIEKRKISRIIRLIKNQGCYSSRVGLVTDMMYAMNLENILLFLYKKL